jgi:sulfur-carrier protein
MNIEVLFFGQLADITGCSSMMMENPGTVAELKNQVVIRFPALIESKFVIAVNNKMSKEDELITDNSKIAFMPPFSGG